METNNIEFRKVKNQLYLSILLILAIYLLFDSKDALLVTMFIIIIYWYFQTKSIVRNLYTDIRKVISYVSQDKASIIKDGDLGLMYDEIVLLKRRSLAYEETIQLEKEKLRRTIEDICHQLKTPLTSISIYTELLLEKEKGNNYLIEVDQQIEKMKYLIQNLLKLAKLQSHQIEFDFNELPVKDIINLSIQSLHSLIKDTKIKIEDTNLSFYYDENWLQEAFSNIIKNSLEENCSHIHISFEEHQQYIKVYIYNDGKEISEKDLPHIFERFYHSSKQNSVGIGLALSKEIIERHHGNIIVYNQQGVIFEVTFPRYQVNDKYKVS